MCKQVLALSREVVQYILKGGQGGGIIDFNIGSNRKYGRIGYIHIYTYTHTYGVQIYK